MPEILIDVFKPTLNRASFFEQSIQRYINNFEKPTIHPAIEYLRQLQTSKPSENLQSFLSRFDEPRPITIENFAMGVKKFIDLASPVNTLKRGFSITRTKEGAVFKSVHQFKVKEEIMTQLADGFIESQVQNIERKETSG